MRRSRPGRGKISAGGIDGSGEWELDRFRERRNRASLRDQLDRDIGTIGDDTPRQRRVTTVKEHGGSSKLEGTLAQVTKALERIDASTSKMAQKMGMTPISTGGERNYVALP